MQASIAAIRASGVAAAAICARTATNTSSPCCKVINSETRSISERPERNALNTGTTIVTFLMVFLIQQSQNKDSVAVHLKLNELLASNRNASNRMIGIEELDEQDALPRRAFAFRLDDHQVQIQASPAKN